MIIIGFSEFKWSVMLFSNMVHGLMQRNTLQPVPMSISITLILMAEVMFSSTVRVAAVLDMLKNSPTRKSSASTRKNINSFLVLGQLNRPMQCSA